MKRRFWEIQNWVITGTQYVLCGWFSANAMWFVGFWLGFGAVSTLAYYLSELFGEEAVVEFVREHPVLSSLAAILFMFLTCGLGLFSYYKLTSGDIRKGFERRRTQYAGMFKVAA